MEFLQFKKYVRRSLDLLVGHESHLYYVDVDKDTLWDTYLSSFPAEIRQEFNCNSCKSFIKNYGGLVAINSQYQVVTYWDFEINDPVFAAVRNNMRDLVLDKPVVGAFISPQAKLGTDYNYASADTGVIKWEHFFYQLPSQLVIPPRIGDVESKKSEYRDNKNVFQRGLREISFFAIDTVLELIADNNLYRGEQFQATLLKFKEHLHNYAALHNTLPDNYCWYWATKTAPHRIRNTSIGTLLVDISNNVPVDQAVRKFEAMVAPINYRRPKAVVSSRMIAEAQQTINELGLTAALNRRFATLEDIDVNNLLWINRNNSNSTPDIFGQLQANCLVHPSDLNPTEIDLETFTKYVLRNASSLEVLFENKHTGNLLSLITSDYDGQLFSWNNPFSWSYRNALADSLKEKVKSAGGCVEGLLRISLEWFGYTDLDLHMFEPGQHIYYAHKTSSISQGQLDVDQNVRPDTLTPVENIIYPYGAESKLRDGQYLVKVHNFTDRQGENRTFRVEIEHDGQIYEYCYQMYPRYKGFITVCTITVTNGQITIPAQATGKLRKIPTQVVWGMNTSKFYPVSAVMHSPNYWESNVGNKHIILAIKEAKNTEVVRGIFNEFLHPSLNKHSKVFEVLGSKLNIPYSDNQLSGLGFSSTIKTDFIVRVNGNKTFKVVL